MKFKVKNIDPKTLVKTKIPSGASINYLELEFLSRKMARGFMIPKQIKTNVLEFSGPTAVSLSERLQQPISKYDFFFIIEQIVLCTRILSQNNMVWNKVVWDLNFSFINVATREIQLLYIPLNNANEQNGTVIRFIQSMVLSAKPIENEDGSFISRFSDFLRTLNQYNPDRIEDYIRQEERSVINTMKKYRANSSGFMTDKRQDYYKHLEEEDDPTALLDEDEETGLLMEDNIFEDDEDEETGLLQDDEITDILKVGIDDEDTVLLDGDDDSGETTLLDESHVHFPSLFRVRTGETIYVDKPVFRIGKERSYVDYFVSNNNAVSRSHADIITRGSQYYVKDQNSKNRTFINEIMIPITVEMELSDGDKLRLGNEEFIFHT